MQYASMSDSEREEELFRDESSGPSEEERAVRSSSRKSRKSSSNPGSSEDEEARKARRKSKKKSSKRPMTEEEMRARNSRRSAKMEAEAAGLEVPPGAPAGISSTREGGGGGGGDPRASRRSTRPSGSAPRQESTPGAHAMSGSRGIDEAVKLGDDYDAEDPQRSRQQGSQGRPAPRPSSAAKKKQEINKDFKDVLETGRWGSISKREMWIVGIVGVLVVIGVIVAVVVVTTTGGDEPAPAPMNLGTPPPAPTFAPTARVVLTPQEQLGAIRGATIDNPTTQSSLQLLPEDLSFYQGKANDPTAAPVVRAASWVMYDDPIDNEEWLIVRYALAVIYYSTGGDTWTTTDGWMTEISACDWHGIRCDRFNKHVEELDLSGNNLVGTIPDETNMITGLISLWLRKNNLSGTVPNVALGAIPKLSILYLSENNFNGTIGVELAASNSLKTLFLQSNELTGFLPREFCPKGGVGGLLEFGIDCDKMECFCCGDNNCY